MTDAALRTYRLRQADRALVLSQRLSEWIAHAPLLEEEVALANIALDLLGQARVLYAAVAETEGGTEDDLAYLRSDREFLNVLLVELDNGDFARTMVRQVLHDAWAVELWRGLRTSGDPVLAGVAAKAAKETAYHLRHARTWVVRLGDGTEESRRRTVNALDDLWRFTGELFEADEVEEELVAAGLAVDPASLRPAWDRTIDATLAEAGLARPADGVMRTGGRHGLHTERLGPLLAELQAVHRAHPGASW